VVDDQRHIAMLAVSQKLSAVKMPPRIVAIEAQKGLMPRQRRAFGEIDRLIIGPFRKFDHDADVQQMMSELIENLELTKACLRTAEVEAAVDQWGVMCPSRVPLQVARNLFIRMYPRMVEILHLLGSSSLMALPTEADMQGPLAAELHAYLDTDTATAEERVRLFHLAWDVCCSAFGSRQVLYERYFGGNTIQTSVILDNLYDKEPMTTWVRDFLKQA
jgi:4-hydroxyphenylacetate 3-monooxygenase